MAIERHSQDFKHSLFWWPLCTAASIVHSWRSINKDWMAQGIMYIRTYVFVSMSKKSVTCAFSTSAWPGVWVCWCFSTESSRFRRWVMPSRSSACPGGLVPWTPGNKHRVLRCWVQDAQISAISEIRWTVSLPPSHLLAPFCSHSFKKGSKFIFSKTRETKTYLGVSKFQKSCLTYDSTS